MRIRPLQNKFRLSALSLAIAATAGFGAPVMAQDQRSSGLEEIVVTAQRREASLQDTPIAITAFTEDKLNDLGVFDMAQVGDFAPNVFIGKQPSSNSNMGISIRGVGISETSLLADPKVGVYIDGVYMSKTVGGVFDIVDLERIEVLRGPQGTLFGRNTTGGAMNVTTKKPTGELGGRAEASVGNYGYMRYGGSLDLPAVGDLAAKVSYMAMETDGWAKNHYDGAPVAPATKVEDDLASEDNKAYRIALRWTPTESLTFDYSYDNTDNKGVPTPFQVTAVKTSHVQRLHHDAVRFPGARRLDVPADGQHVGNPKKRHEDFKLDGVTEEWLEVEGHTFTAAWEVADNLTLKYIYGKRKTDSGYDSTDLDGGAYTARDLFYGVFAGNNGKIPTPGFHAAIDKGIIDMDSHEFQIIGTAFEEKLNYTGGLFYYEEDVEQINPQTSALPIAFVAGQGAYTPVLGPLYDAAGFCPAAYGGYLCVGTQRLPIPGASDPGIPGLVDFHYGQNAKSWAAYGQGTYAITEQFDLTLGVRYTEDEKDAYLYNQNIPGTTDAAPGQGRRQVGQHQLPGQRQLRDHRRYQRVPDLRHRLQRRRFQCAREQHRIVPDTVRQGGSRDLGTRPQVRTARQPPAPERGGVHQRLHRYPDRAVRGGYRWRVEPHRERGCGHLSGHRVRYHDGAGRRPDHRPDLRLPRCRVRRVHGAQPGHQHAGGYLQRDDGAAGTGEHRRARGAVRLRALQFRGAVGTRGRGVQGRDRDFHAFQNQYDSADDRTLVNGRISLNEIKLGCCEEGSLRVSLWGKNLTDEEYRQWGIDFGSLGFAGDTYGEPRTYGLDVVYNYN